MKLWLLKPRSDLTKANDPWSVVYDCTHGFVVRAETEEEAREFAHEQMGEEGWSKTAPMPWRDPDYSTCEPLTGQGEPGVVLRDFHAG